MSLQKVMYVDPSDKVVGSGTIENAYKKGHVLRIARIFIINDKGEILLQKRSKNAKWDQSAGGHVDEGETYLEAAKRELAEEVGIQDVTLTKICKFYTEDQPFNYIRKRFNVVYCGKYNGAVAIDNDEVADYLWISPPRLDSWIQRNAQDFTAGFLDAYTKLQDKRVV